MLWKVKAKLCAALMRDEALRESTMHFVLPIV
jgi:hypothetical protein